MAWTEPAHSKAEVDRAGAILLRGDGVPAGTEFAFVDWKRITAYDNALEVINNFRSSHSFPLNTFQATLRRKALHIDQESLVAQRVKRLASIEAKLRAMSGFRLSQMQDIGGCRAVLGSIDMVRALVDSYVNGDLKHTLLTHDDYLVRPRTSGYRGVHLIYRYLSDKTTIYNGLKIELQLRSKLQHAWATAVETVGVFTQQALKSNRGGQDWLRFFALMGSAIARKEGSPLVPGTPATKRDLVSQVRALSTKLDVRGRLSLFGSALHTISSKDQSGDYYFILELNPGANTVTLSGYPKSGLGIATADYLAIEKRIAGTAGVDAVLVSAGPIASLRRAYPNYFLDTGEFLDELGNVLG